MERAERKPPWAWVIVAALVVLAGVLAGRWLLRGETLEHAARATDQAVLDRNAGVLLRYVHRDEVAPLGLNEAKVTELCSFAFRGDRRLAQPSGPLVLTPLPQQQGLVATRHFRLPDGRSFALGYDVFMTDDGPLDMGLSSQLVMTPAITLSEPGRPPASGLAKIRRMAKEAQSARAILGPKGLSGIVRIAGDGSGRLELRTWEDMIANAARLEPRR